MMVIRVWIGNQRQRITQLKWLAVHKVLLRWIGARFDVDRTDLCLTLRCAFGEAESSTIKISPLLTKYGSLITLQNQRKRANAEFARFVGFA
jgi:hypothetical protein